VVLTDYNLSVSSGADIVDDYNLSVSSGADIVDDFNLSVSSGTDSGQILVVIVHYVCA
jgi:hypothetical protein